MLLRTDQFDLTRLQESRAYDLLMRLPLLLWFLLLAFVSAASLDRYRQDADPELPAAVYSLNIAMRLSVIAYVVIVIAAVLVRIRPKSKARGIEPRISALLGTFLFTAVVFFPRYELSLTAGIISTLLLFAGNALAILVLVRLRSSFSVMAEARQLVTFGIYHYIRHPLYLAEGIASIGVLMQFLSPWTLLLFAGQIAFQLRRIHNEEAVLGENFPEYAAYKVNTARLIPGIY